MRVKEKLHLLPGSPGLNVEDFVLLVQAKLVQGAHVQDHPVLNEALPAHAVALAGGGDFQMVVAGELQRVSDVFNGRNLDDAVDGSLVEVAGVVDESPDLFKRNLRRRRDLQDQRRGFALVGIGRKDKVRSFFFPRRGRVVEKLFRREQTKRNGEKERNDAGLLAAGGVSVLHKQGKKDVPAKYTGNYSGERSSENFPCLKK